MVGRRHLHCDDVVGRRFVERRTVVVKIVNMTAVQYRLVMIIGYVRMHGVERHQRETETQEGNDDECKTTHSASLSSTPHAVPVICIG